MNKIETSEFNLTFTMIDCSLQVVGPSFLVCVAPQFYYINLVIKYNL